MTYTTRTEFAERDGGTGVVIRARRADFVDPDARDADQAQLLRRVAAHVTAGSTDLSDRVLRVDPYTFLDRDQWEAERELFFRQTPQLVAYKRRAANPQHLHHQGRRGCAGATASGTQVR